MYKKDDKIVFKLPDKEYNYRVVKNDVGSREISWFLSNDDEVGYNEQIFGALNITDKMLFCRDVSGCDILSGQFPEIQCPDSTGISKVINKLMEMCEEKMKESLETKEKTSTETTSQKPIFKVGDYVRVIFRKDVKNSICYRFRFPPEMLKFCGEIYIIHQVSDSHSEAGIEPDDGMLYILKTIGGNILPYNFASSMLTSVEITNPQLPFLKQIKPGYTLVNGCISTTADSETKTVSKKLTPEYKLKFTN
jgi:hypothetical protein